MELGRRKTLKSIATTPVIASSLIYGPSGVRGASRSELNEAPESKKLEVQATLVHFRDNIPEEESERIQRIKEISTSNCGMVESVLPEADIDAITTEMHIANQTIGVLKNIIGNINKAYDVDVSTKYLDSVTRLTKFVPFLSSAQNFLDVCCEVREKVEGSADFVAEMQRSEDMHSLIEKFYISLFLVLAELTLLPLTVGYRPAFVGTRYVANYGLVRIRHVVGLRGYSILLSLVHWALRGTIEGAVSYIVRKSTELVHEFGGKAVFDIEEVTESDLSDYEFLEEQESSWGGFDIFSNDESPLDTLRSKFSESQGLINSTDDEDDDSGGWLSGL